MTEPSRPPCLNCKQPMAPDPQEVRRGGAVVTFIECYECGHKHPVSLMTMKGVRLRDRLDLARAKLRNEVGDDRKRLARKVERLRGAANREIRILHPVQDQWAVKEA